MQIQLNLIPFYAPPKAIKFSFFKQKKDESFVPFRRKEFPLEVLKNYENELGEQQNLYCNFADDKNADFNIDVDLNSSTRFAVHYFRHLIREFLQTKPNVVVSTNKINDVEIYLPAKEQKSSEYTLYYCFTIKVQCARVTSYFEMVISFDGVTRCLNKSLSEMQNNNLNYVSSAIIDSRIYSYKHQASEVNNCFDKAFPIISNSLKKSLGLQYQDERVPNRYTKASELINGLAKRYIFTDDFKTIIHLAADNWYVLPSDKIQQLGEESKYLLFADYKSTEKTDKNPVYGFKKIGPYKAPAIPASNFKVFFIYQESTGKQARDFFAETLSAGMFDATSSGGFPYKKIKPLSKAVHQPFTFDSDIIFNNLDTALSEIDKQLNNRNFPINNTYLAIYISPINKDSRNDEHYQYVYAGIKELLIKYGITSQGIYEGRMNETQSLPYQFTNIYAAILAKIGGIPWKLATSNTNDLIIGVGAFCPKQIGKQYIGSAFRFDGSGIFNEFSCVQDYKSDNLTSKIRKALEGFLKQSEGNPPKRIIIHFYKEMSKKDWEPILKMLKEIEAKIPVIVATIYKTETKDIVGFDIDVPDKMPLSGTFIKVNTDNTYLLYNNTKYDQDSFQQDKTDHTSFHFPIKVKIESQNSNELDNPDVVRNVLSQIYQLSRMYWKSVDQQNIPITVIYPEMIAEIVPFFQGDGIPNPQFGCHNLWFL